MSADASSTVEAVAERIETAATDATRSPVERLLAFGVGVLAVGDEPCQRELIAFVLRGLGYVGEVQ